MKKKLTTITLTIIAMMSMISNANSAPQSGPGDGDTRISGIAYWPQHGECLTPPVEEADYAITLTGDLTGCLYIYVESFRCTPGGAYYETGTETFVGTYAGGEGTFRTNYVYTAIYKNCGTFDVQLAGRCQPPISAGGGTGSFDGVLGRSDMRDDGVEGNFPYRGHLRWGGDTESEGAVIDLAKDKMSFEDIILSRDLGSLQRC